jgi:glycosyltransferase involved in cell wall biosynthesis
LSLDLIKRPRLDVFFSPTHYGPLYTPCPEVIAILDVSYRHFPELFKKKDLYQLNIWGGYSARRATKIITISESSKDDIINEYKIPGQKIEVIHLGVKETPEKLMSTNDVFQKFGVNSPYILFVGTIQPRKNIERLVEAFSKIKKDDKKLSLVIIGKKGWMFEDILDSPKKYGVESSVLFLHDVTDQELPRFYENAQVFVLPSLNEATRI